MCTGVVIDKIIYQEFANNHLRSGYRKRLANSIIRKYVITNQKPNKIDDTIRKYLRFHYRKYEKFLAILSVKLILQSDQIKYIRRQQEFPRNGWVIESSTSFFSQIKIIKEQLYSRILELRITFVSRFENITIDHYLIKPKSKPEWKLLAMFDKNPQIVHSIDFTHTRCNQLLFQEFYDIYVDGFF